MGLLRSFVRPRMARSLRSTAAAAVLAFPVALGASAHEHDLRNWFGDPFFKISSAVADCPEPAGPRVTEAERQAQSHRRAEKGTTCWLAKECERPNAYAYDRDIAESIQAAVRERLPFPNTSLWVTVQGRVIYVEGCVSHAAQAAEIEAFIRTLPHVQRAVAIVTASPRAKSPYRLFRPR